MSGLSKARYFSKLDASTGFWQMRLDTQSSMLTCFNTPFGRYRFLRLPFGISSAPKIYHKAVHQIFEHIEGVNTNIDDIIVWGSTVEEHNERLQQVLDAARTANLKLNKDKCVIGVQEMTFIGDVVSANGVKPDPLKVKAITEFQKPTCKKEIQQLLGMVNYLSRYIPDVSSVTAPLRQILEDKFDFTWEEPQETAFNQLKGLLSKEPVLKFYDPDRELKISADASQTGIGAVLLQKYDDAWLPVAYGSRSMNKAETRYAHIEKEVLAMTFACERFHQYIFGQDIQIETDHKPLLGIFKKALNDCPIRIQRLLLILQMYSFHLTFTPGKYMFISDALSRAYVQSHTDSDISGEEEVTAYVDFIVTSLPVSDRKLVMIKEGTVDDFQLQILKPTILEGFLDKKSDCPKTIVEFWNVRNELSYIESNGLLMKGSKVIIPHSMRKEMLQKIHVGHLWIEKCKRRARHAMYWPGMNQRITEIVQACSICMSHRPKQTSEPLMPHPVASYPWQKIGVDLCTANNKNYLVICDYYSNYPEVCQMKSTSSESVIKAMKFVFAGQGIPQEVFSDNGPQFSSREFNNFASNYDFECT
ncbi:MAG: RNase H-like domain-containing protein [Sedimenticola sp.]